MVAWLNTFWAASYELRRRWRGVYFGAASLDGCGYPSS